MSENLTPKFDDAAEPALLASEEFHNLADSLPQFICYVDSQQRYRFNNRRYRDFFKQDSVSLTGQHIRDVLGEPAYQGVRDNVEQALVGSRLSCLEKAPMNGRAAYFEANYTPDVGPEGVVRGFFASITEVTESYEAHRQLEDTLRQAQKLEALGARAGGIVHDFNNILTTVLGYAELAQQDFRSASGMPSRRIDEIVSAAERGADLVKGILVSMRGEETERTAIDAAPAVAEAVQMAVAALPASVEVRRFLDPAAGIIRADRSAIHRTVLNLCTNAAQAMGETGGVLSIRLQSVSFTDKRAPYGLKAGVYVLLSVSDTGPGVDPAIADQIFERFFTTKRDAGGTGLGLATVRDIVTSNGGAIALHSATSLGARFDVYFPKITHATHSRS